jgi:hypothetical protein
MKDDQPSGAPMKSPRPTNAVQAPGAPLSILEVQCCANCDYWFYDHSVCTHECIDDDCDHEKVYIGLCKQSCEHEIYTDDYVWCSEWELWK